MAAAIASTLFGASVIGLSTIGLASASFTGRWSVIRYVALAGSVALFGLGARRHKRGQPITTFETSNYGDHGTAIGQQVNNSSS
jgi:hypothetical protein